VIGLKVDVIVFAVEPAALAAKRATRTVPIVVTEFGLDPVKTGLVGSLGRPEGNITGLSSVSEDLWAKRLQLLKQLAPKVTRVATLWNPGNPRNQACVDQLKAGGSALGIQLRAYEVRDARTLDQAFVAIGKEPTDAIAICWDSATHEQAKPIGDFALARRLPTVAPLKEYAQAGALLSLGVSLPAERRRSAYYVSRILKGAKPSDLPIELPALYELILNKRTVQSLGIAVPPAFAVLVDELVE
jgi:putative ABC transport system substrate-binding protein